VRRDEQSLTKHACPGFTEGLKKRAAITADGFGPLFWGFSAVVFICGFGFLHSRTSNP